MIIKKLITYKQLCTSSTSYIVRCYANTTVRQYNQQQHQQNNSHVRYNANKPTTQQTEQKPNLINPDILPLTPSNSNNNTTQQQYNQSKLFNQTTIEPYYAPVQISEYVYYIILSISSLLLGASIVHNIYQPDLTVDVQAYKQQLQKQQTQQQQQPTDQANNTSNTSATQTSNNT